MANKIVSIGFLTERDLERLGEDFRRHIPLSSDNMFADLIAKLDKVPFDRQVVGSQRETSPDEPHLPPAFHEREGC